MSVMYSFISQLRLIFKRHMHITCSASNEYVYIVFESYVTKEAITCEFFKFSSSHS